MIDDNAKLKNIYLKIKGGILDFSGESMEPVFKNGDKVKVEPVEAKNIKTGNIIGFNRNILVCHRVWGRFKKDDKFYFWEKGDNSDCIGYISEDEIIGKAVYLVEKGKIKKPVFYFNKKIILLVLLEIIIYPYIKIADLIKKYIFFRKQNLLSRVLGTIVWKVYYFYFNILTKKRAD